MKKISILICEVISLICLSCKEKIPNDLFCLAITEPPYKIEYYEGDTLILSGLIVTLVKLNGTEEDIYFSEFDKRGLICSPNSGSLLTKENEVIEITHFESNISVKQAIKVNTLIPHDSNDIICPELIDIDLNRYKTVKIGNQWWMAENLKVTHYSDGADIPYLPGSFNWYYNYRINGYCWVNDAEVNRDIYGALYSHDAALNMINAEDQNEKIQGVCPTGWHIPRMEEWEVLIEFLGGTEIAGAKMKATGDTYWGLNNDGTNESGFTALPAGVRETNFKEVLRLASFWSFGERENYIEISKDSPKVFKNYPHYYERARSVRCIKD